MKYFIDARNCCQPGLSIVYDKWKAWEARDHRSLLKLREIETAHLKECTVCNPTLLLEALFGQEVQVTDG